MKIKNFSLRIEDCILEKIYFIAKYEGRSTTKEIEQLIRKRIADFEKEHGIIEFHN